MTMTPPPTETIQLPVASSEPDPHPGHAHLALRWTPPLDSTDDCAILYLHGFGSCQDGEKAAFFRARTSASGMGFCSFDFQGHGTSGGTMLGLTASRNLADVAAVQTFLNTQGIRRIVLMGSSMGGACALWYAALHPENIVAAVHIAPALELEAGLTRWAGDEGMVRWQREGRLTFSHDLVTCDLSWRLIEDLRTFDRARLEANYQTPTLLLQGVHDSSVSWRAVVDFATQCTFEGIELHLFANGDHRLLAHLDHLWRLTHSFLLARKAIKASAP